MGFFDDDSIIGFDFNCDGKADIVDDIMYMEAMEAEEAEDDEDEDDLDFDLELSGFDRDELEDMDEDERREALEDAGLDPDDYDFY